MLPPEWIAGLALARQGTRAAVRIRQERRPNSRYAQFDTCKREVLQAEHIFRNERLTTLSTTHTSIEEIASKVLTTLGIHREMF